MADKKLTDLNTLTYATAADPDLLIIEDIDGSETKVITAENLAVFVLENRTIGGTTAGDIVTIDGTQTLTGKTMTSPKLNEDVAVTSSATEVNVLDGIDAALTAADLSLLKGLAAAGLTNAELGCVNGVTSAIQTQLNAINTLIALTSKTYTYRVEWADNAGATKTIEAATIIAACGVPSGYGIDHTSIIPALYYLDGTTYTSIALADSEIKVTRQNIGGGVYGLDDIAIGGLDAGGTYDYCFVATFKIVAQGA
jgi:hypothetical protein